MAEAVSGFSNSGGGVILWGVSTDKHGHSDLDILTQINSLGFCKLFAKQVDNIIPRSTTPSVKTQPSTILYAREQDTKGIAVTYIPPTTGDPVQVNLDHKFYFRIGDEFTILPYEILKRMFLGTRGPDLSPDFPIESISLDEDGFWHIPIAVQNNSNAVAEHVVAFVEIMNQESCNKVKISDFTDMSDINPGRRVYSVKLREVVHRGLKFRLGKLLVNMKREKLPKRLLILKIDLYASHMRAKRWIINLQLAKTKCIVKVANELFVY